MHAHVHGGHKRKRTECSKKELLICRIEEYLIREIKTPNIGSQPLQLLCWFGIYMLVVAGRKLAGEKVYMDRHGADGTKHIRIQQQQQQQQHQQI